MQTIKTDNNSIWEPKTFRQIEIFSDKKEKLVLESFLLPNGEEVDTIMSYVTPYVVVIPILDRKKIMFRERYAMGVRSQVYTFISGFMNKNENIYDSAQRISLNKIGIKSKNLVYLTSTYENANTSRNPYHIFIADITNADFANRKSTGYKLREKFVDINNLLSVNILDRLKSSATIGLIPYVLYYCQSAKKITNYSLI